MKNLIAVAAALLLVGCASPAKVEQMAVFGPPSGTNVALKNAIGVAETTGGKDTNPMWTSQVSTDSFRRALEVSLENAGIYSKILANSKYQLTADLIRLDQPILGLDMNVSSSVRYSLIERSTRKEVYGRVIDASYTAKFSDAFIGSERLRLANEGAVKANIRAFITDMVNLKLP